MVITIVRNRKLFIQFDELVESGVIHIDDQDKFSKYHQINYSDFEIIELPKRLKKINIQIDMGNKRVNRTLKLEQ